MWSEPLLVQCQREQRESHCGSYVAKLPSGVLGIASIKMNKQLWAG
jgi:hypothetical protein